MLLLLKQKDWKDYSEIHVHISLQLSTKIDVLIHTISYEKKMQICKGKYFNSGYLGIAIAIWPCF